MTGQNKPTRILKGRLLTAHASVSSRILLRVVVSVDLEVFPSLAGRLMNASLKNDMVATNGAYQCA